MNSDWFTGDYNEFLYKFQDYMSPVLSYHLFEKPANKYLEAGKKLKFEDELTKRIHKGPTTIKLIELGRFDEVYSYLAAYHRSKYYPSGQIKLLFKDENDNLGQIAKNWINHFDELLNQIMEVPEISRALIKMAVYQEEDPCQEEESHKYVMEYLEKNFTLM